MAKITATCEKCGAKYQVADSLTGKRARCKKCRAVFLILSPAEAAAPVTPAVTQEANAGINPESWKIGDVILDTYEVLPVTEDGIQKPFHQAGGMGRVYKVRNREWDMDMAVKVPKAEKFQNASQKANFVRECHTWMDLGLHPHIVTCGFVRVLGEVPCVFAEYIDGGSLKSWIDSRKLYEGGHEEALKRILDIAIQFARGLDYAHEKGMIHQDVKPDNLLLEGGNQDKLTAKVADFGMINARAATGETISSDPQRSIVAAYGGGMTEAYCSPEQADILAKSKAGVPKEQLPKLTRRTDIWSWAVSVFEMFKGEVTWRGGQVAGEALEDYLDIGIEDDAIPPMPEALGELLRHCFQRSPDDRPGSMAEVCEALEAIYQSVAGRAYPHDAPSTPSELSDILNNKALSFLELSQMDGVSSTDQETMKVNAEAFWKEALKLDVHHLEATYNHGLYQWRAGRATDTEVVRRLEAVSASHEDSWRDEYLLGLVHIERGDAEAATGVLSKAAEATDNASVWNSLGIAKAGRRIWGRCVCALVEGNMWGVTSVVLSGDGQYALSGSGDRMVRLWDLSNGKCMRIFDGHTKEVTSVALSADGRHVLSGSRSNRLRLWEVASGRCVCTFEGHTGDVYSVALSGDGRYALSGSYDKTARLWDLSSGSCIRVFEGHTGPVTSVALSWDGQYVVSGSGDRTARLWELSSGTCIHIFEGHASVVTSVALSCDGRHVASGSYDKTVRLWDLSSGGCVRIFDGHANTVTSVALSRDGRHVLSGSRDSTLRLWKLSNGICVRTFEGHAGNVYSVALSGDGGYAVSGSRDETIRLWNLAVGETVTPAAFQFAVPLRSADALVIEGDYRSLLDAADAAQASCEHVTALRCLREARSLPGYMRLPGALRRWKELYLSMPRRGLAGAWHTHTFEGHTDAVNSVALSGDGRHALSGSQDKTLRLWDLVNGICVRTFDGHAGGVKSVALSEDGQWVLSGGGDKTLRLWDSSTGACIRTLEGHAKAVTSVTLSSDCRHAVSGSWDKTIRVWDLSNGTCIRVFERHTNAVTSVTLSGDNRRVLSGGCDLTARLWGLSDGGDVRTSKIHAWYVESVALSSDGRHALTGSTDKEVHLLDLPRMLCRRIMKGHTGGVNSVALSSDGRYALSGSTDKTVRLWDMSSATCVHAFEGHGDKVISVAVSADGQYVLSGSADCTLRLWTLDWELEEKEPADWDGDALPWLQNFLTLHCPCGDDGISRVGTPNWNDDDFKQLLHTLGCAGYGWLRPEGVRKKLEEMTTNWQGPPPLPWE
jgi:WD40 repeat protein/serine/threonine protein kinase